MADLAKSSKTILIVGNGPTLLNSNNGPLIDSFDDVVRFNSYKIKGYEEQVGTKTTIYFTVNRFHIDELNQYKKVYCHSWEWNKEKCKLYKDLSQVRDVTKMEMDIVNELAEYMPDYPLKGFSTGLIAIHYFLKSYDFVTITGFDWWQGSHHHYGDKEIRGDLHKPDLEYDHIKWLESEGKLRFL